MVVHRLDHVGDGGGVERDRLAAELGAKRREHRVLPRNRRANRGEIARIPLDHTELLVPDGKCVGMTCECRDGVAGCDGLLGQETPGRTVGAEDGDVHGAPPLWLVCGNQSVDWGRLAQRFKHVNQLIEW